MQLLDHIYMIKTTTRDRVSLHLEFASRGAYNSLRKFQVVFYIV